MILTGQFLYFQFVQTVPTQIHVALIYPDAAN